MPTLMAAEDRVLAFGRRVLLVEDFALPAAVRRRIGAEIIEEGIAAENAASLSSITPVGRHRCRRVSWCERNRAR